MKYWEKNHIDGSQPDQNQNDTDSPETVSRYFLFGSQEKFVIEICGLSILEDKDSENADVADDAQSEAVDIEDYIEDYVEHRSNYSPVIGKIPRETYRSVWAENFVERLL